MIFWPGGTIRSDPHGPLREADLRLHLFSFYHERHRRLDQAKDPMLDFRFFADSGAFSAWMRGDPIDLEEYIAFVRYHIGYLDEYASLDVIPSSTHPAALEQAAQMSWENYKTMLADGLNPIPIYHYGESRKWLHKLIEFGCDYIGLGGMGNANRNQRIAWLDSVFDELPTGMRVHGFGVSAINMMFRWPWYSVDSTTWRRTSAIGSIFIPHHDGSKFLFDRPPYLVHRSELIKDMNPVITQWLELCGTNRQHLFEDYRPRSTVNAIFMREVASHHVEHGHKERSSIKQGLFK